MIVSAEHQVNVHVGERAEDALRVFEAVALRELAFHWIVMHDDDAGVAGARTLELGARPLDLGAAQVTDDRDVTNVPGERVVGDTLCRVETHEGRTGDAQHRLDLGADVRAILGQHLRGIAEAKRRIPPRDVVVARHDDRLADSFGVLQKRARALELAGAGALRDIAGHRHDVELSLLDHRFDRLVLLGHRGMPEMQIGAVKQRRDGHSAAMMASVN